MSERQKDGSPLARRSLDVRRVGEDEMRLRDFNARVAVLMVG